MELSPPSSEYDYVYKPARKSNSPSVMKQAITLVKCGKSLRISKISKTMKLLRERTTPMEETNRDIHTFNDIWFGFVALHVTVSLRNFVEKRTDALPLISTSIH